MIIALIHICRGNFLFLVPHFSVSSFRFFSLILRTLAFFDEIRCIHLCLYFIFGSICCMFFPCCFSCCLFLFSYYSFHWFLIPFRNSQSHLSILRSFSDPLRRKTLLVAPICFLRISIALLWIVVSQMNVIHLQLTFSLLLMSSISKKLFPLMVVSVYSIVIHRSDR